MAVAEDAYNMSDNVWKNLPASVKNWIRYGKIKGVSVQTILYIILVISFFIFIAVLNLIIEIS